MICLLDCGGGSSSGITLDSTFLANLGNSAGGSGCNWRFPDGLTGTPITWHLPGNDYTVPTGKNLYITNYAGVNQGERMQIDGLEMMYHNDFDKIIISNQLFQPQGIL